MGLHFETSEKLCKYVADKYDGKCYLSFSCGIDSIACFYQLKKYFEKIVPVYMYCVPNLEFVERQLNYFENKFDTKIYRFPHPQTVVLLMQSAYNYKHNSISKFFNGYNHDAIYQIIKSAYNLQNDYFIAIGNKQNDNPMRRMSLKKWGSMNLNRKTFYPIFDWSDQQVANIINENNCKVPIDYKIFGRSFDGLVYRFMLPLKKYFPNDYAKIKEYFPLIDLEIERSKL